MLRLLNISACVSNSSTMYIIFIVMLSRPLTLYLFTEILRISLIESELGKEFKGDINISVVVIGNFCYGDWGSKWNSIA